MAVWSHTAPSRSDRIEHKNKTACTTFADANIVPENIVEKVSASTNAGMNGKALKVSASVTNNTWIMDSDATEHMTCESRQVETLKPSTKNVVSVANGNPAPIIREGTVSLSNTLSLDIVLVVPSLDYNLLYVAQITVALHCLVIFWPSFCVFKDIQTRKTIGYGIGKGKLYYLELTSSNTQMLTQALTVGGPQGEQNKASEVWLWHHILGHASFGYLRRLFPSLILKSDVSSFKCGVCELAISHRTSFPSSFTKTYVPFMIIHSDVWGLSRTATFGGAYWFVTFIDDSTRMTWVCFMKSKS